MPVRYAPSLRSSFMPLRMQVCPGQLWIEISIAQSRRSLPNLELVTLAR